MQNPHWLLCHVCFGVVINLEYPFICSGIVYGLIATICKIEKWKYRKLIFNSGFLTCCVSISPHCQYVKVWMTDPWYLKMRKELYLKCIFKKRCVLCNLLRYGSLMSYISNSYCLPSHKTYEKYRDVEKRGTHCFIRSVKNSASEICGLSHNTRDILKKTLSSTIHMSSEC